MYFNKITTISNIMAIIRIVCIGVEVILQRTFMVIVIKQTIIAIVAIIMIMRENKEVYSSILSRVLYESIFNSPYIEKAGFNPPFVKVY